MKYGAYIEEQLGDFPDSWHQDFINYGSLKSFIKGDMVTSSINLSMISPPPILSLPRRIDSGAPNNDTSPQPCTPPLTSNNATGGDACLPHLDRAHSEKLPFDELLATRLLELMKKTPQFCRMLDAEIERMNRRYELESEKLREEGRDALRYLKRQRELLSEQPAALNEQSHQHLNKAASSTESLPSTPTSTVPSSRPMSAKERLDLEFVLEGILLLERFAFLNYTAIAKILKKHDKWTGIAIRDAYMIRISRLPFVHNNPVLDLKERVMNALAGASAIDTSSETEDTASIFSHSPSHRNLLEFLAEKEQRLHLADEFAGDSEGGSPSLSATAVAAAASSSCGSDLRASLLDVLDSTQTVTITLRGPHGTDIIGAVLDSCMQFRCRILDFSLSRVHHHVSFGVVVKIPASDVGLFNHLAENARKWDATLTFDVQNAKLRAKQLVYGTKYRLEEAPYDNRVKYAATVLNEDGLTSIFLDEWCKWLLAKRISIERMRRLDSSSQLRCIEFILSVPKNLDIAELRRELFEFSSTKHHTDVALQPDNVFRRQKRLVVFDMDSTLIQQEVIDEIARGAGIVDKVAAITEAAMRGEIDFRQSLKARVALLKHTPADIIEKVKQSLVFTEGARDLCRALKNAGFKLAVISGGFLPLATYVKSELGLDYAFANQLQATPDGKYLTGNTTGPIVDADRKAELLEVIAQAENISKDQVVAVGDGANDLKMLERASLGIAFNAKPRVQKMARTRINQSSLVNILHLMGYSEVEAKQLYT